MVGSKSGTGAGTVAMERVEIVTCGERRRSYTPEEKARLLAETAEPARGCWRWRSGTASRRTCCIGWRREAEGRPVRKLAQPVPRLVPLLVGVPAEAVPQGMPKAVSNGRGATIEVVLRNGRVLRVGATMEVAMVARLTPTSHYPKPPKRAIDAPRSRCGVDHRFQLRLVPSM